MAQGSVGNVLAAVASLFIPGLGQLLQGRLVAAIVYFLICMVAYGSFAFGIPLWPLGFIVHIWSVVDAARFK